MLVGRYIVGFTGHRKLGDEFAIREGISSVVAKLKDDCESGGGSLEACCSVAEGADVIFTEVSLGLGISVHLVLPLPESEFAKDFSDREVWNRSVDLISQARQSGQCSVRTIDGQAIRPDCYYDQGIRMLEACDVLVAVWDGQDSGGRGGTAQMIEIAKRDGIPVILISSTDGKVSEAPDCSDVFKADSILSEINEIALADGMPCATDATDADSLQLCLDQIAINEAGKFRPTLVRIILVHAVAALMAATVTFKLAKGSSWEEWKWAITATELLLVSWAFWATSRLHHRHTQQRWIRCRFACELVRSLRASVPIIDPLHPVIRAHDPTWSRFAMSAGLLANQAVQSDNPTVLRDEYVSKRLSETHKEGQIRHFMKMRPAADRGWKVTGIVASWSATLAPIFVLLSLVNKLAHLGLDKDFSTWILVALLPIALPLIAGAASGIRHALDAGRRRQRYPEMVSQLQALRSRLEVMETEWSIRHIVDQTEDLLLDELREWQLSASNTGAH